MSAGSRLVRARPGPLGQRLDPKLTISPLYRSNKKKRKFDGLLATDFGSLSDSLPPAQKLCLTPFPDLTYTRPVVQYGRIRAMEAEVRELEQSIAEMEAAIEQAESQVRAAVSV